MATGRRDRVSEEKPAKSDNGRTGADPEGANQTTPPSGSLHREFYKGQITEITPEPNYHDLESHDNKHTQPYSRSSYVICRRPLS
ncbi:hypothetical protein T02_16394 [Trichinella nativa]|uniref:Uncharacterized protein n=1 Tax=Trichinella nativa TaxID=6335 RepID=A0A0V1KMR6_9BILA|nr:hypothetical protein T02_16394 [Trichinella nativa]